jgi:hypothetical protein
MVPDGTQKRLEPVMVPTAMRNAIPPAAPPATAAFVGQMSSITSTERRKKLTLDIAIEQPPALVITGAEGHPLASVNDTLKGTVIPLQSQVRDTVVDMALAISVVEPAQAPTLHSAATLKLSRLGCRRTRKRSFLLLVIA